MSRQGLFLLTLTSCVWAQAAPEWDLGTRLSSAIAKSSGDRLILGFEQRSRFEDRTGNAFGREVSRSADLLRTRLNLTWKATPWLTLSGMAQDSRAPLYGPAAPNTVRDPVDLQEGYLELFPGRQGFGASFGRRMINYGETRLIGSPQWGNLARTYDQARVYWRSGAGQFEVLFISPVKIRLNEFNRPVLGERIWGMYHSLKTLDVYVLRHDQNRSGGFTGEGRLRVNTFGIRRAGALPGSAWKYSLEGALQNGGVGPASHRAGAWFVALTRRWQVLRGRPLDLLAEYKFASGTSDPSNLSRVSTFDQMYPSNHDKFGHEDLFGWRNMTGTRSLGTIGLTRRLSLNVTYLEFWLAQSRDALYNGNGRVIVRSADGSAGRYVGRETDIYATWKSLHFLIGAGYGHLFAGRFLRNTTPGVGPGYAYIFHNYSF